MVPARSEDPVRSATEQLDSFAIDESFLNPFIGIVQTREVHCENGRLNPIRSPIVIGGVMNFPEHSWEKIQ